MIPYDATNPLDWGGGTVLYKPPKSIFVAQEILTLRHAGKDVEYVRTEKQAYDAVSAIDICRRWVPRDIQPSQRFTISEYRLVEE